MTAKTIMVVWEDRGTAADGTPLVDVEAAFVGQNEGGYRSRDGDDGTAAGRCVETVGGELQAFCPADARLVVADAASFRACMGRASGLAGRHVIDLTALARIFFPDARDFRLRSLGALVERGAARDVDVMAALWNEIERRAAGLSATVLACFLELLDGVDTAGVREFFDGLALERPSRTAAHPAAALRGDFSEASLPPLRARPEPGAMRPIDAVGAAALLGRDGVFAAGMNGYEYREGQLDMARAVAEALNESKILMVEAGTGIGKSLAYLVPAALWALENGRPVVVSTNTKNLQAQLFEKDLPVIRRALELQDLRFALIKGRMNYLCLRKLIYLLGHGRRELETRERAWLPHVLGWSIRTTTGDFAESSILERPSAAGLRARLASMAEECPGRSCPHRSRCFLRRARALAQAADVIVANHSLVFAEMNIQSPALPEYSAIVLDEAHNLEETATRHFSVDVSALKLRFVLRRLWQRERRGTKTGRGLIATILNDVQKAEFLGSAEAREGVERRARVLLGALVEAVHASDTFFEALDGFRRMQRGGDTVRLTAGTRDVDGWESVDAGCRELREGLEGVRKQLESLADALRGIDEGSLPFHQDFVQELESAAVRIQEFLLDLAFVTAMAEPDTVFWLERTGVGGGETRACAAPVDVGHKLAENLYAQKDAVIFASATLTVRGSFGFMSERLGLSAVDPERLATLNAGSPFDYARQCALFVPMFLPEPSAGEARDYATELGELLAALFERTRGRGMVLFTSYDMLRRTTAVLREILADERIDVLAQGISGSRENITALFRDDLESVLMGTHSFWEGVDLVGETLSCLVLARLPFAVYTDPIQAARSEKIKAAGGDPFRDYSLPNAVIRFRQGFGRLIRHRSDRGVVLVSDRRIVSRSYGRWFRSSVPVPLAAAHDREELLTAVETFLSQTE